MRLIIFVCIILFGFATPGLSQAVGEASYKIGGTYTITSVMNNTAVMITVQANGKVTTEWPNQSPEQRWTVARNPHDGKYLELKQGVVPYNELSGYQSPSYNPTLFPRRLDFTYRGEIDGANGFQLRVRDRWCLQVIGPGAPLDRDECEDHIAKYQIWRLDEVK